MDREKDSEIDLDILLDTITWGHRIVELSNGKTFVFRPLSVRERNMANYFYNKAMKCERLKSRKQLEERSIKDGSWTVDGHKNLELLSKELGSLKEDLDKEIQSNQHRQSTSSKQVKLQRRIDYVTKQVNALEAVYLTNIELPSREYYAEKEKAFYKLFCCTLNFPDMDQAWPKYQDFKNETDKTTIEKLLGQLYRESILEESQIRKLARSGLWRIKWIAAKESGGVDSLFGRPMQDLTVDQFRLLYWSQVYDSAFEAYEPPSDDIVEDDDLFDQWLDDQAEKRKQEAKASELNKKISKYTKAKHEGQEVGYDVAGFYSEKCTCGVKDMPKRRGTRHAPNCPYGVFIYYSREHRMKKAEEIQSANPEGMRKMLAAEQKRMADSGHSIEEQHLRNNPKTRAAFGMETRIVGKDKR